MASSIDRLANAGDGSPTRPNWPPPTPKLSRKKLLKMAALYGIVRVYVCPPPPIRAETAPVGRVSSADAAPASPSIPLNQSLPGQSPPPQSTLEPRLSASPIRPRRRAEKCKSLRLMPLPFHPTPRRLPIPTSAPTMQNQDLLRPLSWDPYSRRRTANAGWRPEAGDLRAGGRHFQLPHAPSLVRPPVSSLSPCPPTPCYNARLIDVYPRAALVGRLARFGAKQRPLIHPSASPASRGQGDIRHGHGH